MVARPEFYLVLAIYVRGHTFGPTIGQNRCPRQRLTILVGDHACQRLSLDAQGHQKAHGRQKAVYGLAHESVSKRGQKTRPWRS